ncbi:PIG-L family deacetylase [Occallatibacter savannae]|uniref:PIG-L family deacetylase n=1 Tax=Occallatibacter savannae TaxID=1002691 RepID=UPI000D68ED27|nr:PIG-L family deacetylase [Occallatibacter savannae]
MKLRPVLLRGCLSAIAILLFTFRLFAQESSTAPEQLRPDARFKADVLVVVAHEDDEVMIAGYLAKLAQDEHKRIAVVYVTNGDGGGNAVGNEAGAALGQERQMEARRALASIGIENVWFLNQHDTPNQNVLFSLGHWDHGHVLGALVRLMRITRPDVVLTWLPDPVSGENHADHQASSVVAAEAFDAAGDATKFAEQISPAKNRTGMSNLTEGLLPWQPQKLYFFTDAYEVFTPYWYDAKKQSPFRKNLGEGTGPSFAMTETSPSRHMSYAQIEADEQTYYMTQEGQLGVDAVKAKNFKTFEFPVKLILGKSVVGGSVTGDVFEGVRTEGVPFKPVHGYAAEGKRGVTLEIGDPWRFYSLFWNAHDLDRMAALIPVPEMEADYGEWLNVELRACNYTDHDAAIDLSAELPTGWVDHAQYKRYPVRAGECYPVTAMVSARSSGDEKWDELTWTATQDGHSVGSVTVRVFVGKVGSMPR